MSNTDQDAALGKAWYASKGVWGGIIAAFAPVIGLYMGIAVDPQTAQAWAGALAAVGGLVAIYGRINAKGPIIGKK